MFPEGCGRSFSSRLEGRVLPLLGIVTLRAKALGRRVGGILEQEFRNSGPGEG